MKTVVCLIVVAIFIVAGASRIRRPQSADRNKPEAVAQALQPTKMISIGTILQAHNVLNPKSLSAFSIDAVRVTLFNDVADRPPQFYEERLSVSTDGRAFKRHTRDILGLREEYEFSDGQSLLHTTVKQGRSPGGIVQLGKSELAAAKFQIATFGLVPILRRLSSPGTTTVYLESTPLWDKFKVLSGDAYWVFYADRRHLIRRLEIGDITIDYADYHLVDGLNLPSFQRASRGAKLMYELVFDMVKLNPEFAPDDFRARID